MNRAIFDADRAIFNQHRERIADAEEGGGTLYRPPGDSALGSDAGTTTTTMTESIYNFRRENGRTYHAYKDGKYPFPNDDREADRLDLMHHIFNLTFNTLHHAPLSNPRHALDIGTGTGIWAVDFADKYPNCRVIGTDLSPGQPSFVPPNLRFIIDDAEDDWVYPGIQFDYIHLRLMAGCFNNTKRVLQNVWNHLAPGGYIEFQDYGLPLKSADRSVEGTYLDQWGKLLCEAARRLGRPMGTEISANYKGWMQELRFVDIEERTYMWPTNSWPKDPYMKELGRWNQVNILDGMEGFCLALLTRGLGWSRAEVDIFVANISNDVKNKNIHAYFPMPVVWARKPFAGEHVPTADLSTMGGDVHGPTSGGSNRGSQDDEGSVLHAEYSQGSTDVYESIPTQDMVDATDSSGTRTPSDVHGLGHTHDTSDIMQE